MADRLVLVTGATGAVGPAAVRALLADGCAVRTFSTRRPPEGLLPPQVDVRVGDITDADSVRAAVAGSDVVVHLAALLHQVMPTADLAKCFERVNVEGTRNVVRAALDGAVTRLVLLSTIAVYGPSADVIDESRTPHPDTEYGRTKLAAEQLVLSAAANGRSIGTVLRAAAVYGARIKGNYRRLALAIARHRYVPLGPESNRRTLVHDRDLGNAIALAARHPAAAGAIFNVSDGKVHTLGEIVTAIHRALGRTPPRFHLPLGFARAAAAVGETAFGVVGRTPPFSRAVLAKYTEDTAVDGSFIQRVLGFTPVVDLESGWKETMDALLTSDDKC
jgi:nucleoside-diphosphate-sugar epimerase